ncbi:prepilin-type N-terminal cleavage/methylation domain-containing protein [Rickettsiales bacterium]|nr:prepilin-type N-terminal cleavage/methylation domain-containing protein [Rickettsiales bacterium]
MKIFCAKKSGFTLVEMAIVIVIISLITVGIMTGKSLVKQAEIAALMKDVEKIKTAYQAYKLKFDAQPGDHNNAVYYLGAGTENGDGNRQIDITGTQNYVERFLAWEHLTLSKLYPGLYPGTDSVANKTSIGENVPKGSVSQTGFEIYYDRGTGLDWTEITSPGNYITFAAETSDLSDGRLHGVSLSPVDIWGLEKKYDDEDDSTGLMGKIRGMYLNTSTWSTLCYDKTKDSNECFVFFKAE